ncbi:LacI family transcriptional regulator [Crossiella equi]|uniref:LacI family transcriptional regulator n=1 Tax=Crossiella equi TaxID=130796 RepID=A0ABS5ALU1_9PSEU|nr:LacI family DNA-binding transcriptional regulator [Crossiella equi]MBP2477526.1 LacI family transcriptional regulator [Crossiella equi]
MAPSVSVREVAELAGVSLGTVSNVLNSPDRVAPRTRERVLAAMTELGFVRNESARQLRSGTGRTIGLVVLDVGNPFFTDVARGVEEAATEAGHSVILCNSDSSPDREHRHLEVLAQQRVHGVLITPCRDSLTEIRRLQDRGVSVVLLDHPATATEVCAVTVDDHTGGHLAVAHLLERGHRRLAMVTGAPHVRQAAERRQGAESALKDSGVDAELVVFEVPSLTVAAGLRAGLSLLASEPRPTAVFCANDLLALGVLQAMVRTGVRVPQEMAIVGYDDIDFAAAAAVPLTSVHQPRHLIGRTAAQLVIAETLSPTQHEHQQVYFTPELVVREST